MKIKLLLLTLLFSLSGMTALIYEAIWARYLKLLLGHSSYGQILTLCIFMGGIGLGSFLAGKKIRKISKPLLLYSLVEGGIGVLGLLYHTSYLWVTSRLLDSDVLLGMSGWSVVALKWVGGACITLPSAVLMGTTFPLMVTALIRMFPREATQWISKMYFVNALGGVIGVLLTSYAWIDLFGTIGTLVLAGSVNIVVGCALYLLAKSETNPVGGGIPAEPFRFPISGEPERKWIAILLAVSALTGLSSFFYEIGWIRLLSLVLGSSTHSFDLMIAAFILGLAAGSYAIHRFHGGRDSMSSLAWIQVLMGASACISIYTYDFFFVAINNLNLVLVRSDAGYLIFSFTKWILSILMMCPTSFFAGMTLPLITSILWRETGRESYTGHVYGWNTLGSIVGAALGGLVLLPVLQLEKTIAVGATIDVSLGILLLFSSRGSFSKHSPILVGTVLLLIGAFFIQFKGVLITSGAFRTFVASRALLDKSAEVIHGRTATISVETSPNLIMIKTNGKVDASLFHRRGRLAGTDNLTQSGLAYYAMGTRTAPYRAAVIGLGSGMTAHYLLGDSLLKRMDLIEIEPAVYRLAQKFKPYNERIYSDSRFRIHFEDARTFFAGEPEKFDVIVSEPSNPWVSGVSNLFSVEFFRMIRKHLRPDGVMVQWMHLYEFSDPLLMSILVAIAEVFPHFEIYRMDDQIPDIAILINNRSARFPGLDRMRRDEVIGKDFTRLGVPIDHFSARQFVASGTTLAPLLKKFNPNSDYFPIVDNHSEKAFFTKETAQLPEILGGWPMSYAQFAEGDDYRHVWEEKKRYALEKKKPPAWKLDLLKGAIGLREIPDQELQARVLEAFPLETWPEMDKKSVLFQEAVTRMQDSAVSYSVRNVMDLYGDQSRLDTLRALEAVKRLIRYRGEAPLNPEVAKQMFLTALWGKDDSLAVEVYRKLYSRFSQKNPVEDLLAQELIRFK